MPPIIIQRIFMSSTRREPITCWYPHVYRLTQADYYYSALNNVTRGWSRFFQFASSHGRERAFIFSSIFPPRLLSCDPPFCQQKSSRCADAAEGPSSSTPTTVQPINAAVTLGDDWLSAQPGNRLIWPAAAASYQRLRQAMLLHA